MPKLLVLGGTNFIGRNLVDRLLQDGNYDLTLFNRGITNPDIFPEERTLHGDRNSDDINVLGKEDWDAIIDVACYYPDGLQKFVDLMEGRAGRYTFVSTCSVYDNAVNQSILRNEDAKLLGCSVSERTDTSPQSYGQRKAECERILSASKLDSITFRPALVYGPHDHTDRLYYWLFQAAQHQQLLMPGRGERTFSVTYVADLVSALVQSLKVQNHQSVYNAISAPQTSIGQIVAETCRQLGTHPELLNARPDFLKAHNIQPWEDMPLWLDCDYYTYSNQRLITDFYALPTSLTNSLEATISYYKQRNWPVPDFGISEATRAQLIQSINKN